MISSRSTSPPSPEPNTIPKTGFQLEQRSANAANSEEFWEDIVNGQATWPARCDQRVFWGERSADNCTGVMRNHFQISEVIKIREELLKVVRALNDAGVPYALAGGLAVTVHGYPRLTKDIDLIIPPDAIEEALEAVGALGFTLPAAPMTFRKGQEGEQRIHRISRIEHEEVLTIDFMLAGAFLEDVWADREQYELDGIPIVVASRKGLIKMKRSAGRSQDLADLERLESGNEPE